MQTIRKTGPGIFLQKHSTVELNKVPKTKTHHMHSKAGSERGNGPCCDKLGCVTMSPKGKMRNFQNGSSVTVLPNATIMS